MTEAQIKIIKSYLYYMGNYNKASIGDIASKVGITKSTVYSHFDSANDLKTKTIYYCLEQIQNANISVDFKIKNPEELLAKLVFSFVNLFSESFLRDFYFATMQNHLTDIFYQDAYTRLDSIILSRVRVALEYCVQESWLNIKNTDIAANFFTASIKEKIALSTNEDDLYDTVHDFVRLFSY